MNPDFNPAYDDVLDLDEDDDGVSEAEEEADAQAQWRRSAQTAKGMELYREEREKVIVELLGEALRSTDPRVSRLGAKIHTLDAVVKFFGGKTKEEELR